MFLESKSVEVWEVQIYKIIRSKYEFFIRLKRVIEDYRSCSLSLMIQKTIVPTTQKQEQCSLSLIRVRHDQKIIRLRPIQCEFN